MVMCRSLLLLSLSSVINVCYSLENDPEHNALPINNASFVELDINGVGLPAKRTKLNDSLDFNEKRQEAIDKIYSGYLLESQLNQFKHNEIFPDQDFDKMSPKELIVFRILWPKNTPLPDSYVSKVMELANLGDPVAQRNLGTMHVHGQGVEQSDAEAVHWYRKAAEQSDAKAQYALGSMYRDGQGVERNYTEAVYWYRKAAEQDLAVAKFMLGAMHVLGRGVEQSYAEAVRWVYKAAEQGLAEAQFTLGSMYYKEHGVEQSYTEVVYWYLKAAKGNHQGAQQLLKNVFSQKVEAPSKETLDPNLEKEKAALEADLGELRVYYDYYLGFAKGGYKDAFGKNDYLHTVSTAILQEIANYLDLLGKHVLAPEFMVSCLEQNKNNRETSLYYSLLYQVPGNKVPYLSFSRTNLLKEISTVNLDDHLNNLSKIVGNSLHFMERVVDNAQDLTDSLTTLHIYHPEAHAFMTAMLDTYTKATEEARAEEYKRIVNYLENFAESLENHKAFSSQLNERIYDLVTETAAYRHHLFKKEYPFFFQ